MLPPAGGGSGALSASASLCSASGSSGALLFPLLAPLVGSSGEISRSAVSASCAGCDFIAIEPWPRRTVSSICFFGFA